MNLVRVIRKRRSPQSFTPSELAAMLNRTPPPPERVIKVLRRNERILTTCTPEDFEALFGIPYLPWLTFTSEELLRITVGQCPWAFRFGILGMEEDDLYEFYRRKILQGVVADVTIGWIDDILGFGLYSNDNLDKGAFIGAYTGVVRPLSRETPDHNVYCLHYPTRWWSAWLLVVDADKGGNEMRFANHSNTPNMSLECLYDRGLLRFFLRAKEPICKGEPLTFDYGEDFWRFRQPVRDSDGSLAFSSPFQCASDPAG